MYSSINLCILYSSLEMTTTTTQYNFKILIAGDSSVGKTSILNSFTDGSFDENTRTTIGVGIKIKNMKVNDKDCRLTLWDTASQERFRTLTSGFYRGGHGVLMVYDITCRESFNNLKYWMKELTQYSTNDPCIIIIGNKLDLKYKRSVSVEEGLSYAREQGVMYIEASAKTQQGVKQAFEELLQKIIDIPELCYQVEQKPIIIEPPNSSLYTGYCNYC
jgi:small GTP-binding protein